MAIARISCVLSSIILAVAASRVAVGQDQSWIRQLGSTASESAGSVIHDGAGGVYAAGSTSGNLGGANAGGSDVWLARFNASGNTMWIRQIGTATQDFADAITTDGSGAVYVGGDTYGALTGTNAGQSDYWLAKYDASGNQVWIRQVGTTSNDSVDALIPDGAGGVFVAGATYGALTGVYAGAADCWVARYNSAGTRLWIKQFGTAVYEFTSALAPASGGSFYVCGQTQGDLGAANAGGYDAWLSLYDSSGNRTWIRQFGTSARDTANGLADDGNGGVFIGGDTEGGLGGANQGASDPWFAHYTSAGARTWIDQFGTSADDDLVELAPDETGGFFAGGSTQGDLAAANAGLADPWVGRFDDVGTAWWMTQYGTAEQDYAYTVADGGGGAVFLGGASWGDLGDTNAGDNDAWVARHITSTPLNAPVTGYTVNRGARISGNVLSMMFSDPFYLKVDSETGTTYHVAETTVRHQTTLLNPSRMDLRVETRATESNVQTRIALRNVNTNMWDTVLTYAQPTSDAVRVLDFVDSPQNYVRSTDGLIRVRVQMIRALSRGPFDQWIDHVQVAVWE